MRLHLPFSTSQFGLQARLRLVVALAVLALAGATALSLWDIRRQTIADAQAEMSNLSRSLADQAHDAVQTLDTILVGLRERVETDGTQPIALARLRGLLTLRAGSLDLIHDLAVIDAAGHTLVASAGAVPSGADTAKTAFFRHHRDWRGREMFIGWPIRTVPDGTWVLTVSRRVDAADGSFAGVVVVTVPTAFFRDLYRRYDAGTNGAILLARADGVLVSRWPMTPADEGRDLRAGELFRRVVRAGDQPRIEHRSLLDGTVRFGSYHWVPGAPMFVLAARDKAEVLAGWRRNAMLHLLGLGGVLAALGLLAQQLSVRIADAEAMRQQLTRSNARLVTSEARMARVNSWLELGQQIAQIGTWHLDLASGRVLTWSDELYRLFGQDATTFVPTLDSVVACYHPEDRGKITEAAERAIQTGVPFEINMRVVRPDGATRLMLTRGVPQTDEAGTATALFGVAMDITRQKRGEAALLQAHAAAEAANQALEAANRTLETMAMQDSLTGLANRRHFDRALDQEFRRAVRSNNSLALIMIDVDHFKGFNDLYGHQAGDTCLRAIAALIQPLLNRPGDTAARYGGEEIAILLPGNTEAGAFAMASRIVDAVRERAIAHGGSPKGVVTISAGIAAFVPVHDRDIASQLVAQADKALYAAKNEGRDQVCCLPTARAFQPGGASLAREGCVTDGGRTRS